MIRQLSSVVHNHYNSLTQFATNSFSLSLSKLFIKPMFNSTLMEMVLFLNHKEKK